MRIVVFIAVIIAFASCKNTRESVQVELSQDSTVARLIFQRSIDTAIRIERKEANLLIPTLSPGLNTTLSQSNGHASVSAVIKDGKVKSVNCTCDSLQRIVQLKEKEIRELKKGSTNFSIQQEKITKQAIPWYYKLAGVISLLAIGYTATKIILKIKSVQNPLL